MSFWNSLWGMIRAELCSADISTSLREANLAGISLYKLEQPDELTARFYLLRKDYIRLKQICTRRGEALRICGRAGFYWSAVRLFRRPILLLGVSLLLITVMWLPSRILFFRVEGNETIPDNKILEAAVYADVYFFAPRETIRSEKVKNALLAQIPEIRWAGVNTYGCVAVISVREQKTEETSPSGKGISNILASRDGIVSDIIVTQGNGLCVQGQVVKAGQILISGYTDCGQYVIATDAKGEVFANTLRNAEGITPASYTAIHEITEIKKKISIRIGKKQINLWKDSGIWDSTCGRMYKEYCMTLPGGFSLPLALIIDTYTIRNLSESCLSEEEASQLLHRNMEQRLMDEMIAGTFLQKNAVVFPENGAYRIMGTYLCREMIGRVQQEQIGEYYGKNN